MHLWSLLQSYTHTHTHTHTQTHTHTHTHTHTESMVTAPVKAYVVVLYRPPGQLGDFVHKLDTLLTSIPECPMLVLDDMNIHLDNPNSADFRTLVHSFTRSTYNRSPLL